MMSINPAQGGDVGSDSADMSPESWSIGSLKGYGQ